MRKMLSLLRRCVEDYEMIAQGDRIAVGLSGGKDSLALLSVLAEMRRFYPYKYEVCAITLDMGFPEADFSPLAEFCKKIDVEFILVKTDIAQIIFDERKEKNPCSLCANMRRGALSNAAKDNCCNKLALGHHFDDVVNTFMMSLLYEGNLSCFSPVTYLSKSDITVIRPLIYVPESHIKGFASHMSLPVCKNPCKADGVTKRAEVATLINNLRKENKDIKAKLFGALCRSGIAGYKEPQIGKRRKFFTEEEQ